MKTLIRSLFTVFFVIAFNLPASADTVQLTTNGVTDFFGNQNAVSDAGDASGLLFDETRAGGGDTAAQASFSPSRNLVAVNGTNDNFATGLSAGTAGVVTITGVGFALRGGTTATQSQINVVYLGADGVVGGGDDETVGSATDSINFTTTGEYAWSFDNPLQFNWDGLNNRFRFELTGLNGNLRFKQRPVNESPSGQGGLTLSVGGSFAAIPEPTASLAVYLVGMMAVGCRRRKS